MDGIFIVINYKTKNLIDMKIKLILRLAILLIPISLASCSNNVSEEEQSLTVKMDSLKDSVVKTEKIVDEDIDKVQASLKEVDEAFK
jgi:hypothetical protein